MTKESVAQWIETYAEAWRNRDPEAAAALFAQDAIYRSSPFRKPHLGRDGVRQYWIKATGNQRGLALVFGEPVIEDSRVAVEWWAVMQAVDEGGSDADAGDAVSGAGASDAGATRTAGAATAEASGQLTEGTLPGCLMLRFNSEGLCEELREYWHWSETHVDPPEGWGK